MDRATRVVSGPLALKMQRLTAAKDGAVGLEIVSLPQLAARLAGGFVRPAAVEDLQPAIRAALDQGGFTDLKALTHLPGMVRAVQQTLTSVWRSGTSLDCAANSRLSDLALIDAEVRSHLPPGALAPPDLRDAALAQIAFAPRLFGPIELYGLLDVDPVWRPLVSALADQTPITWTTAGEADRSWFTGTIQPSPDARLTPAAVVCADPHAEVVEALRWARGLMASGVPAVEIGIAALGPDAWDESMVVLSRTAGLPVHFTHGISALECADGQACAALADLLLRGLSQERVRRLLRRAPRAMADLPDDWSKGLSRSAGLFTVTQWETALRAARPERASGEAAEHALLPWLAQLAEGAAAAEAVGEALLHPAALELWREALRAAPAEALEISLQRLRISDPTSPGAAISWGPAWHLAASPRAQVRLLGLSSRAWPRAGTEDPLLPDHVLPRSGLEAIPRPEEDERTFRAIAAGATRSIVLSRSRRSSEGTLLAPSRLFPTAIAQVLARIRTPEHAFSEADRLLARPQEARDEPLLALSRAAWRAWLSPDHTEHDGRVPRADGVVRAGLDREQSATSARRLLRDPLGFVWAYALRWRPADTHADLLALDRPAFGELVHELIRRTVEDLEPDPGLNRATPAEIEAALRKAGETVLAVWPSERPVPPPLLWRRTVDEGVRLARDGLLLDSELLQGTTSFAEVPFGRRAENERHPWTVIAPVVLGGLRFGGRIDRLDLRGDGVAARVTDYKSGAAPRNMERVVLGGGTELQRVIYAAAVRQGLPEVRQIVSRLVYLRDGPTHHGLSGDLLDAGIAEAERFIGAAEALVAGGAAPPGPDVEGRFNDLRLALPAELDAYLRRKAAARAGVAGELPAFWGYP
ncbi:PD-(D/E)XK nuclease superfamily protein [compost metagenome]